MFDLASKIRALVQNYGLELLLEQNEIPEEFVVAWLVEEKELMSKITLISMRN